MRMCLSCALLVLLLGAGAGCGKPSLPSMTGINMFHDISQVKEGMSPNEVRRIMGSRSQTIYEEGIKGVDGGNYVWEYAEGRIYIGLNGVTRVVPFK